MSYHTKTTWVPQKTKTLKYPERDVKLYGEFAISAIFNATFVNTHAHMKQTSQQTPARIGI